jgi:hypothetical protein
MYQTNVPMQQHSKITFLSFFMLLGYNPFGFPALYSVLDGSTAQLRCVLYVEQHDFDDH